MKLSNILTEAYITESDEEVVKLHNFVKTTFTKIIDGYKKQIEEKSDILSEEGFKLNGISVLNPKKFSNRGQTGLESEIIYILGGAGKLPKFEKWNKIITSSIDIGGETTYKCDIFIEDGILVSNLAREIESKIRNEVSKKFKGVRGSLNKTPQSGGSQPWNMSYTYEK